MRRAQLYAAAALVLLVCLAVWLQEQAGPTNDTPQPPVGAGTKGQDTPSVPGSPPANPAFERLRELLPGWPEGKLAWLAEQYGWTVVNIVKQYGGKGAEAIMALGHEGVAVMRENPDTFDQLAERLGGETSVRFLVYMHQHLPELARQGRLPEFLDRVEALPGPARELGQKYPTMLPFLVMAPEEVEPPLRLYPGLCLKCFVAVDLARGPHGIAQVANDIMQIGEKAKRWIDCRGLDGLLLAKQFPDIVDRVPPFELSIFLEALSANQADIRQLIEMGKQEEVWRAFQQVAEKAAAAPEYSEDPGLPTHDAWLALLTRDEHAVRFIVEFDPQCQLLAQCWPCVLEGPPVPSLIIDGYDADRHPKRAQAASKALSVAAASGNDKLRHTYQFLAVMARYREAAKHYHRMSHRVHELMDRLDYRVVFYLMENGGADPRHLESPLAKLEDRGVDELKEFEKPPSVAIQTLPGYDSARLVWILANGYRPTVGEMTFAGMDLAFNLWDLAGIAMQVKRLVREGGKLVAKKLAEAAADEMVEASEKAAARHGSLALLEATPKVLRSSEERVQGLAWIKRCASRSAEHLRIPLSVSGIVAKAYVREWAIGLVGAKGLEEVAALAAKTDNGVWAEKTLEVLHWLENPAW